MLAWRATVAICVVVETSVRRASSRRGQFARTTVLMMFARRASSRTSARVAARRAARGDLNVGGSVGNWSGRRESERTGVQGLAVEPPGEPEDGQPSEASRRLVSCYKLSTRPNVPRAPPLPLKFATWCADPTSVSPLASRGCILRCCPVCSGTCGLSGGDRGSSSVVFRLSLCRTRCGARFLRALRVSGPSFRSGIPNGDPSSAPDLGLALPEEEEVAADQRVSTVVLTAALVYRRATSQTW